MEQKTHKKMNFTISNHIYKGKWFFCKTSINIFCFWEFYLFLGSVNFASWKFNFYKMILSCMRTLGVSYNIVYNGIFFLKNCTFLWEMKKKYIIKLFSYHKKYELNPIISSVRR